MAHGTGPMRWSVAFTVAILTCWGFVSEATAESYSSSIQTSNLRVVWQLTNVNNCTNIVTFNRSSSNVLWHKTPVGSNQLWSTQLGDHHAYYTLRGTPGVGAVSLTSGKVKWEYPHTSIFKFWQHNIDLPRHALLTTPTEIPSRVLCLSQRPANHLFSLTQEDGQVDWELMLLPTAGSFTNITHLVPGFDRSLSYIVLAHEQDATVACINLNSSAIQWESGPITPGIQSIPLVTQDVVVVHSSGGYDLTHDLLGLHAATGAMLWSASCHEDCLVFAIDETTALVSSKALAAGELERIDLTTGKVLWRGVAAAGDLDFSCAGLTITRKHLYLACTCSGADLQSAHIGSRTMLGSAYKRHGSQSSWGTGLASQLCAVSVLVEDGTLEWVAELDDSSSVSQARYGQNPVVTDTAVLLTTSVAVYALDRDRGSRLWTFVLPGPEVFQPWDALLEHNGTVLFTSTGLPPEGGHKYGVDLDNGRQLFSVPADPTTAPVGGGAVASDVRDGVWYTDGCDGSKCCLYALDIAAGAVAWQHCLDVLRVCKAGSAKELGLRILYLLLAAQVGVVLMSCLLTCLWRVCGCARRGVPGYTRLMAQDEVSDEEGGPTGGQQAS